MDISKSHIAVLCGGTSSEREISLKSGQCVYEALKDRGLRVTLIDTQDKFLDRLKNEAVDFVFIALHGKFGEDGTLQALLDKTGIPYAGSGPEACRQAMNKEVSHKLFSREGLQVPPWQVFEHPEEALRHKLSYPVFVKPVRGGSSIGVSLVREPQELPSALEKAFGEDEKVLIEERITGREMAVGIVGEQALPPVEIKPADDFYSYAAKYENRGTQYLFPTDFEPDMLHKMRKTALKAHQILGCEGFSRVDFIVSETGIFILEVNAIPGLTRQSLLPKQALAEGIVFGDLCVMIINESIKAGRYHGKTKTKEAKEDTVRTSQA